MLFKEGKPAAIKVYDKSFDKRHFDNPYIGLRLLKDEVNATTSHADTLKTGHLLDVPCDRTIRCAASSPRNSRF